MYIRPISKFLLLFAQAIAYICMYKTIITKRNKYPYSCKFQYVCF